MKTQLMESNLPRGQGVVILLCALASLGQAQSPLPDSFNPGATYYVTSLAVQADGKVLVGGWFTDLGGQTRNRLGRLNADGTLDPGFNPGANNYVFSLAVQPDGKILVGGWFTTLGGQPRNCLGRLNADGTLDTGFNPGVGGGSGFFVTAVYSLTVQADGKILIGGNFTTVAGVTRNYIARLEADGTLDSGFNAGAVGEGFPKINSLAVQTDGKILVGGNFTMLGGEARGYIARLNSDGTLDTGFAPEAEYEVYSLALQADGRILVGGYFTTLAGRNRNYIARLNADGTLDADFDPGADNYVETLSVQTDGKILVGGLFRALGGQPRPYLARLNPDGTLDPAFAPEPDNELVSLALQADGRILVGGAFRALGGQRRSYVGRLNNTEPATQSLTYDSSTVTWLRGGASPEVWRTSFDYSTNGSAWTSLGVGSRIQNGWQVTGGSVPPEGVIRARGFVTGGEYNGSGWFLETLTGLGAPVLAAQPSSRTNYFETTATFGVSAGGTGPLRFQWFKDGMPVADGSNISGATTAGLTLTNVLKSDEGEYSLVVSNALGSVTSVVATLTVLDPAILTPPLSQIKAGGESVTFSVTAIGTVPLAYQWWKDGGPLPQGTGASLTLTNLQGDDSGAYTVVISNLQGSVTSAVAWLSVNLSTLDLGFDPGVPLGFTTVNSLTLQADGKILVGGSFTNLAGRSRSNLGRLNPDGTLDLGFNPGTNGVVNALVVQADGKILVGGGFTNLAGQPRSGLGRLNPDGTLDLGFNPGTNGVVNALVVQADGKILVGGGFTNLAGQPRNYLGRLNPDGTLDLGFNPGASGVVYTLAVQSDGKLLVGGTFTNLAGQTRNRIARLNADGTLDSTFDPGAAGGPVVASLAAQADGKILVGGRFTTVGGQTRTNIARLNGDGTVDTEFNPGAVGFLATLWTLAVQADGKILIGGRFSLVDGRARTNCARLNADGTLDSTFVSSADGDVLSLALQADGKILMGGTFNNLAGQPRSSIARMNKTGPATQSLSLNGSSMTWLRGGTSPEVWSTTFDHSTNAVTWTSLGAGSRIPGGWQLSGFSVPPFGVIRARGYVSGGRDNGSGWFVETLLSTITIPTDDGSFGVMSNQFGFNIRGVGTQLVVVEGSSNLVQWTSLSTNSMIGGQLQFSDPGRTVELQRFYRARLWP